MQCQDVFTIVRMRSRRRFPTLLLTVCIVALTASAGRAEISVGTLTRAEAKDKYGITMHARKNGDAGIQVWIQFKKQGWLEKFTYAELRMKDAEGKHLISARLQPNPVHHGQSDDVTTLSFSADADQLGQCRFLVVCYNSNEGDVGYNLNVRDFLDLNDPVTEQ
jgi:hypothetical protein